MAATSCQWSQGFRQKKQFLPKSSSGRKALGATKLFYQLSDLTPSECGTALASSDKDRIVLVTVFVAAASNDTINSLLECRKARTKVPMWTRENL